MIEVLDVPARAHDDPVTGRAKFYFQKVRVTTAGRDGFEEVRVVDILSNPDNILPPGDDYIVDPTRAYVSSYTDKGGNERTFIALPRNVKLIRLPDFIAQHSNGKPALKVA